MDIVNSNNRTALDIAHSRVRDIILKKIQDKSLLGGSRELLQLVRHMTLPISTTNVVLNLILSALCIFIY